MSLDECAVAEYAACATAWTDGWTIPPPLSLSAWADEHRMIPRAASAEPGRWRTARTPYLREIMDCLSESSPVTDVSLRKSTQVGGTEIGINWAGYIVHHCPGPAMVVMPTVEVGKRWAKQRFAPIIELMPCLSERIAPARSRDSGNTTLLKEFPGGVLIVSGANSSSSLRSMPIRYLFLDELDEYPDDLNEQGSAQEQAERRTSSFARRKILRVSTPTVKDASAIDRAFEAGDQRYYHVPCPQCSHRQKLVIDQLTDDGKYLCIDCGALIEEHHKTAMLEGGEWIPENPSSPRRSYHLWSAYAPIGLGYSWSEIAELRRNAKADAAQMVTFTNTILGESYEGFSQRVEANELAERAEKWRRRTIPRGCLLLTAGIDVQANRFAIVIAGWGRNETCWIIDQVEIPGDPTRREDWEVVDEFLERPIVNAAGIPMRLSAAAFDSGNWTHDVYRFVRPRQARGYLAIKGSSLPGKPIIGRSSRADVDRRGRSVRFGLQLWLVGTDTAKHALMQRLLGDADLDPERRRIHFPADLDPDFYEQLTSERYDTAAKKWVRKPGVRNEYLDGLGYSYAAAVSPRVRIHTLRESDFAALEAKLEPPTADLFAPGRATPDPDVPRKTKTPEPAPSSPRAAPSGARNADEPGSPFASDAWRGRL